MKTTTKTRCLAMVVTIAALTGGLRAGEMDDAPVVGLALTGRDAVDFLTTAEVSSKPEDFDDLAITSPRRLELTKGDRTLRVIFKDENTLYSSGMFKFGDGREVPMVKDSYLHEIAAFELARMLGLDMVPACVERKLFKRKGSLCLWVEGAMTEAERKKEGLEPPDRRLFNEQMFTVRLFQQLISDQDFSNIRNILVDSDFRVYKVDSSLAFYPESKLISQLQPPVYSREAMAALRALDRDELVRRLEPWLTKDQLKSLWERREKILERADKLMREHGEDKILY
jgi:hypothetical protein